MWEKIKTILQHPAARMLKKYCGDPVQLYSVFLTMTAMYYYHEDFWWVYTPGRSDTGGWWPQTSL